MSERAPGDTDILTGYSDPEPSRAEEAGARGTILIFTADLLPFSETFVRDHLAYLRRYRGVLVGARHVAGIDTSGLPTTLLAPDRFSRFLLWFGGISPALDRLVRQEGVVAIHAHFADAGARIARYARRRRLPLLVTLHGADVLRRPDRSKRSWVTRRLLPSMTDSAAVLLPVSDYLKERAARRGYPRDRMRRHYLGIPLKDAVSRRETSAAPTILFVGRLVEKKGLVFLIEACRLLKAEGRHFRLRVIGDGPLLADHRAQAAASGIKADFVGAAPGEVVAHELQLADIFCMPSVEASDGDNEGLGLVCLEAQAARLPVVAFDQGPVPEAVANGRTGLLASDRSAAGLAQCLARLLDDPGLRQKLGEEGRRTVARNFDIVRQSRGLEQIYDEVLTTAALGDAR